MAINVSSDLKLLKEETSGMGLIGRGKGIFNKYGDKASLFFGKVAEEQEKGLRVSMDSLSPHVVYVVGSRGSGKSYTLGVLVEEIAKNNKDVGTIVIDPVGIFWSMKYPNVEDKEKSSLEEWGLSPYGFKNVKVYIPKGFSEEAPKGTWDAIFTIRPGELTVEDWCLTYDIPRFGSAGLLLERSIEKVQNGWTKAELDGEIIKSRSKVAGKGLNFGIAEMINCIDSDEELISKTKGFTRETRRGLMSRLRAAEEWGIFDSVGTRTSDLSSAGRVTIIDVSSLSEKISALVVGILSRKILMVRKKMSREESAERLETGQTSALLAKELEQESIPPTWIFVDEAHTLIPSGESTPATRPLIEYIRQGRRPGCSIVMATQQPSAIDSKALAQVDIMIAHKLTFEDDVKAIRNRMPCVIPKELYAWEFIKTIPIGCAMVGDRSQETSRAFVVEVRPRMSQHEGRAALAKKEVKQKSIEEVKDALVELITNKVFKEGKVGVSEVQGLISDICKKYNVKISSEDVLKALKKKGEIQIKGDELSTISDEKEAVAEETAETDEAEDEEEKDTEGDGEPEGGKEAGEALALPKKITPAEQKREEPKKLGPMDRVFVQGVEPTGTLNDAYDIAKKVKKGGGILDVLGQKEIVEDISLHHYPIWRMSFDYYPRDGKYRNAVVFIDAIIGELVYVDEKGNLKRSRGFRNLRGLPESAARALMYIKGCWVAPKLEDIAKDLALTKPQAYKAISQLLEQEFIKEAKGSYSLNFRMLDVPKEPDAKLRKMGELLKMKEIAADKTKVIGSTVPEPEAFSMISSWGKVKLESAKAIHFPYYIAKMKDKKGNIRLIAINGVSGEIDQEAQDMLIGRI